MDKNGVPHELCGALSARQLPIYPCYFQWQFAHLVYQRIARIAVHIGQVVAGLFIDRDAERLYAVAAQFQQGMSRVFYAVAAVIVAVVLGFSVRQGNQQFVPRRFLFE